MSQVVRCFSRGGALFGALLIINSSIGAPAAQAQEPAEPPSEPIAEAPPPIEEEATPAEYLGEPGADPELAHTHDDEEAEEALDEPPEPPPPSERATWIVGGVPLKLTGSYFTRYEHRQNYDLLGVSGGRFTEGDFTVFRSRIGLGIGPIDIGRGYEVAMQFTPQATGVLGALDDTILDARAGVYEGYLRLQSEHFWVDAGRFMMNYGDSLVIGSLDWHQTGRSFDGFRSRMTPGKSGAWVDFFFTFLAEGWPLLPDPYGAGDHYFMGIYSNVGPAITEGLDLDLYALGQLFPTTDNLPIDPTDPMSMLARREGAFEGTLGARAKHRIGPMDYRAEGGIQFGTRPTVPGAEAAEVFAYQIDAELGLHLAADQLRLGLEGMYASGNDPDSARANGWNQLYPTGHKFLGLSDAFGARTNVASGVFHLLYKPMPRVSTGLDAHVFARPQPTATVDATGYAGAELDLGLNYVIGDGLVLRGMYALFLPGEDFYLSGDPLHYLEIEFRYDLR